MLRRKCKLKFSKRSSTKSFYSVTNAERKSVSQATFKKLSGNCKVENYLPKESTKKNVPDWKLEESVDSTQIHYEQNSNSQRRTDACTNQQVEEGLACTNESENLQSILQISEKRACNLQEVSKEEKRTAVEESKPKLAPIKTTAELNISKLEKIQNDEGKYPDSHFSAKIIDCSKKQTETIQQISEKLNGNDLEMNKNELLDSLARIENFCDRQSELDQFTFQIEDEMSKFAKYPLHFRPEAKKTDNEKKVGKFAGRKEQTCNIGKNKSPKKTETKFSPNHFTKMSSHSLEQEKQTGDLKNAENNETPSTSSKLNEIERKLSQTAVDGSRFDDSKYFQNPVAAKSHYKDFKKKEAEEGPEQIVGIDRILGEKDAAFIKSPPQSAMLSDETFEMQETGLRNSLTPKFLSSENDNNTSYKITTDEKESDVFDVSMTESEVSSTSFPEEKKKLSSIPSDDTEFRDRGKSLYRISSADVGYRSRNSSAHSVSLEKDESMTSKLSFSIRSTSTCDSRKSLSTFAEENFDFRERGKSLHIIGTEDLETIHGVGVFCPTSSLAENDSKTLITEATDDPALSNQSVMTYNASTNDSPVAKGMEHSSSTSEGGLNTKEIGASDAEMTKRRDEEFLKSSSAADTPEIVSSTLPPDSRSFCDRGKSLYIVSADDLSSTDQTKRSSEISSVEENSMISSQKSEGEDDIAKFEGILKPDSKVSQQPEPSPKGAALTESRTSSILHPKGSHVHPKKSSVSISVKPSSGKGKRIKIVDFPNGRLTLQEKLKMAEYPQHLFSIEELERLGLKKVLVPKQHTKTAVETSGQSPVVTNERSAVQNNLIQLLRFQIAEGLVERECPQCFEKIQTCCCCPSCSLCCHCVCPAECAVIPATQRPRLTKTEVSVLARLGQCQRCKWPLCSQALRGFIHFTRTVSENDLLEKHLAQCWSDVVFLICNSGPRDPRGGDGAAKEAEAILENRLPDKFIDDILDKINNQG